MLYILAILLPPLAVAWTRRPWHLVFNLLLTITVVGYLFAIFHAVYLIHGYRSANDWRRPLKAEAAALAA